MALLSLTACGRAADRQAPTSKPAATLSNETAPAIPPPGTGPDARTPLGPVKPAIDPKSAEAAGQVVQHYGALIEQRRWSEAESLWGNQSTADAFARQLRADREVHLEIGQLGQPEGAAGSTYVTMPSVFYGIDRNGESFRRPADIILRLVNDVPGSTEAQRRWHIERIDWNAAA
ncbi:MAG: hypothetical protein ABI853_00460 [Sphingomicrobium sp.]